MPTTWDELVESVTARYPVHEGKMFGMPCLKRENGKVVAGRWKDSGVGSTEPLETRRRRLGRRRSGLTVKLTDEAQREAALAAGAGPFDPGMGRVMREWVLVPASKSDDWERLVEQAVSGVGSTEPPRRRLAGAGRVAQASASPAPEREESGGAGFAGAEAESG